jgi:hypothetical protein
VIEALGPAPIGQHGDAGEAETWVCYTLAKPYARLWLTSSELGGGIYVDGLVAKQISPEAVVPLECPQLDANYASISVDNDIWLGEPVEEVATRLGPPNKAPGSLLYYAYQGKDGDFDVTSELVLRVHAGHITELHAAHTETN